jgi:electron transport complex protein RnfD
MDELKLSVASSPHASHPVGTQSLMRDVLIALIPAMAMGIYVFGFRALIQTIVSVIFCEIFEWGYCKLMHKPNPIGDLSAAITGVLLVFVCPVTLPYWTIIIGDFFAIVIVKQLYGGIGKNFLNPALAARAFLIASYSLKMTSWSVPNSLAAQVDGVTMATPMSYLYSGQPMPVYLSMKNMFFGMMPGCIGEISVLALLIGAAYLMIRKIITWRIPVSFIGTVCLLNLIFGHAGYTNFEWMMYNLLSGALFLGAFFMATDYATTPVTPGGHILFGVGCGIVTVLLRYFGSYPEGVSYAILIMNLCAWAMDKAFRRYQFGVSKEDIAAMKAAKKEAADK